MVSYKYKIRYFWGILRKVEFKIHPVKHLNEILNHWNSTSSSCRTTSWQNWMCCYIFNNHYNNTQRPAAEKAHFKLCMPYGLCDKLSDLLLQFQTAKDDAEINVCSCKTLQNQPVGWVWILGYNLPVACVWFTCMFLCVQAHILGCICINMCVCVGQIPVSTITTFPLAILRQNVLPEPRICWFS